MGCIFGSGKNFSFVHINKLYHNLGKEKSMALPFFHSFTGCETTSAFFRRGKKMAWEAWKSYPDVTAAFLAVSLNPYPCLTSASIEFKLLERFTVVLYSQNSTIEKIDNTRLQVFFAVKTNRLKIYLQQLMHCYSMQGEQPIMQVSEPQVKFCYRIDLHQSPGAGLGLGMNVTKKMVTSLDQSANSQQWMLRTS